MINKKSALEQLREAMEGVTNIQDHNGNSVVIHFAILELAERADSLESRLEALEAKPKKILSVTSAHYELIRDHLVDDCLNGVLVVVDDHEERDPNKAYLTNLPKTNDSRAIESVNKLAPEIKLMTDVDGGTWLVDTRIAERIRIKKNK